MGRRDLSSIADVSSMESNQHEGMRAMKALLISLLLLSGLLLIPQAHAEIQKFPTVTDVHSAGWINPTFAFARDGIQMATATSGSIQGYHNFTLNVQSAEVERAYCDADVLVIFLVNGSIGDYATASVWLDFYNGSGYLGGFYIAYFQASFYSNNQKTYVGTSSVVASYNLSRLSITDYGYLNDVEIRISAYLGYSAGVIVQAFAVYVDAISLTVYLKSESTFSDGFILGGILCALVAVAGVLILEKKD